MCTLSSPCEVPANESSVIVGGLDQSTSYTVTVMAVNSEGEDGPTSVPISAPRTTSTSTVIGTTSTPTVIGTTSIPTVIGTTSTPTVLGKLKVLFT